MSAKRGFSQKMISKWPITVQKKCLVLWIIREHKLKPQWDSTMYPPECLQPKETHNTNLGHLNGSTMVSYISNGVVNWHKCIKLLIIPSITKCLHTLWSGNLYAA